MPALALAFTLWASSDIVANPSSSLGSITPLVFISLSLLPLYGILVLLYVAVAFALRQLKALTRGALFLLGIFASLVVALWLACDWATSCLSSETLRAFAIEASICTALFTLASALWWHLANRGRPDHEQSVSREV